MIRDLEDSFDVAIIGSGISGAVLGMILARHGTRVVVLEGGLHPRFAVGESTIPHTSMLNSLLAERYDVPELDCVDFGDQAQLWLRVSSAGRRIRSA